MINASAVHLRRLSWQSFFNVATGLFLIWYSILPFQNYELARTFLAAVLVIWIVFFLLTKQPALFSTNVLFYLIFIGSYLLRAAIADGWTSTTFLWIGIGQWAVVLFLTVKARENPAAPGIFLAVSCISPLFFWILSARESSISGIAIWFLAIVQAVLSYRSSDRINTPSYTFFFLFLCLASIPFALYPGRSLQYFFINLGCFLLFLLCTRNENRVAIAAGYIYLALTISVFFLSRGVQILAFAGPTVFGMRHHLIDHANTVAPFLILLSAQILFFSSRFQMREARIGMALLFLVIGVREFLTYSKGGWLGYAVFILAYLACLIPKNRLTWQRIALIVFLGLLTAGAVLWIRPARVTSIKRVEDISSMRERIFDWYLGVRTIREHPVFGAGWFTYYSHAKQAVPQSWSKIKFAYNPSMSVHNHSFFLDLAQTCGIPFAFCFLMMTALPLIRQRTSDALWAGLFGVTANNIVDTASFWLTVFPHLWILLAMVWGREMNGKQLSIKVSTLRILSIALLLGGGVLPAVEDYHLQMTTFFHRNNQDEAATRNAQIAHLAGFLDVAPLEQIEEIAFTQQNPKAARIALQKLIQLKKEYPPYYADFGRTYLFERKYPEALQYLQKAQILDPAGSTLSDTDLFLASYYFDLNDRDLFEKALSSYFLKEIYQPPDFQARRLLDQIPEDHFLDFALSMAAKEAGSIDDWVVAVDNFYNNLTGLRKDFMAERLLRRVLGRRNEMKPADTDYFCNALSKLYALHEQYSEIGKLLPYCSPETADLLQSRVEISEGKISEAAAHLNASLRFYNYSEISDAWESLFKAANNAEALRTYYRLIQKFPLEKREFLWQERLAISYVEAQQYEEAAKEYQKLAFYRYVEPNPHFWEARSLWLAGRKKEADAANRRLLRLIPSNSIFESLYQSRTNRPMRYGFALVRTALDNAMGGFNWRISIFAHPPLIILLPAEKRFSEIEGEVSMAGDVWYERTDGVDFEIRNHQGEKLFVYTIDPGNNPAQRIWNRFSWKANMPQAIGLETEPRAFSDYDWAVWSFNSVH